MLLLPRLDLSARWLAAGAAAVLWATAAGSLVLWWLHLPQSAEPDALVSSLDQSTTPMQVRGAMARALGHTTVVAAAPDVQKRFALLGVIAAGSGQGSALLSVDGQPAQAFVRGQVVTDGWRLESVQGNGVRLAPVQPGAGLELPLPERR